MKDMIKLPLTLFIATAVSAILISSMYSVQKPILESREKEVLDTTFNQMYGEELKEYELVAENVSEDAIAVYQVELTNGQTETVFKMSEVGKNGPIKMLISYDTKNNLTNLQYLEQSETPGIGSKITEESFVSKIIGQNAQSPEVDGISGATISSSAVRLAVKNSSQLMIGGEYNE